MTNNRIFGTETKRLEKSWSSEFSDAYVERNRTAGNIREPFWQKVLAEFAAQTVEILSNVVYGPELSMSR